MTAIVILIYLIIGGGVVSFIIGLIVMMCSDGSRVTPLQHTEPETKVEVHVHQETPTQYPGIAEQFDGRLTNVLRNPLEGIL